LPGAGVERHAVEEEGVKQGEVASRTDSWWWMIGSSKRLEEARERRAGGKR